MSDEILKLLKKTGAFMEGHFLLTSGRHSNVYIEKFRLMESPEYLDEICRKMAQKFELKKVDLVLGAATGGILLSVGVAKYLSTIGIFTERINSKMTLRRGFKIRKNSNVLIVEDIVSTGGSILELIEVVKNNKANVIGVTSIVDRNKDISQFHSNYKPLLRYPIESWSPESIPDWLEEIPLTQRGRSGK